MKVNPQLYLSAGAGTHRPREALQKYKPSPELRSSKSPGRFPMRNRFISDYIFDSTGKRRTPKQVGSRLQQMRDTCKGEESKSVINGSYSTALIPINCLQFSTLYAARSTTMWIWGRVLQMEAPSTPLHHYQTFEASNLLASG